MRKVVVVGYECLHPEGCECISDICVRNIVVGMFIDVPSMSVVKICVIWYVLFVLL